MKNHILNICLASTAGLLLTAGCMRRPLDVRGTSVEIELQHDYSLPFKQEETLPEHYRVDMYGCDSTLSYTDFVSENGGGIRGTAGLFKCFVCNYDAGHLLISGEDCMSTFHVTGPTADATVRGLYAQCRSSYAKALSRAGTGTEGEKSSDTDNFFARDDSARVMALPEYLWAGRADVEIPVTAETDERFRFTVSTFPVTRQGRLTVRSVDGIQYISSMTVFLTNMSAGGNPVQRTIDEETVTQAFEIYAAGDSVASGTFAYFGLTERILKKSHMLYLLIRDTGGGHYLYVFDAGRQMNSSMTAGGGEELNLLIETDIRVPEPSVEGGGGIRPSVGDWETVYFEIPLGAESAEGDTTN